MLEDRTTKEQCSVVHFLWAKGLNAKDIHKEMFPVYGGKCLLHLFGRLKKYLGGKPFADDKEVETEVQKWLRQQSKDFYAAGFDALVKRWGQAYQMLVENNSRNFFLQVRISYVSRFTSICDLYTDSLVVSFWDRCIAAAATVTTTTTITVTI
jgi:hypothetical protein